MSSDPTSVVSLADITNLVATEYDLGMPTTCMLLQSGLNDTYAVDIAGNFFALRLRGAQKWWIAGQEDLQFELDLLTFLHAQGLPVSYPLSRRNGALLGRFETRSGTRDYSLFSWAPGDPGANTPEKVRILGHTLAAIHLASDRFQSPYHRYTLGEHTLLDRFMHEMEPILARDDPSDALFIREQVVEIRSRIRAFAPGPGGWGIVHGDVQELNFHFTTDCQITFLDFDLCGYGWRVYDIASYYTRIPEHMRAPFLEGYEEVRQLSDEERDMIPTIGRLAWIREGLNSKDLVEKLHDP